MADIYSRVASASLKKETSVNTAVTPDTFFGFLDEDIATEYGFTPATPVIANRALNIRPVHNAIPAPVGTINVNIEPKNLGHFMNSIFGGVSSGQYLPISSASGAFTVGETVTGGSSTETATVVIDASGEYLLVSGASGNFTDGETITGGTSTETATVTEFDTTVYGHHGALPSTATYTSYTLQFNFADSAIRYMGAYFTGIDALAQSDNVVTAGLKVMAHGQFRHAKVTAITTSGAGAKTITVDQTYGLVASDTVKVYRPSTDAFLDFSAASVKTHTIGTIPSTTTFTVTNLETSLAVDDIIVLAPQTASYTEGNEFPWIGGATYQIGADVDNLASHPAEDFSFVFDNEFEARHAAGGSDFEDLFPDTLIRKGVTASGSLSSYYQNEELYKTLREKNQQAVKMTLTGSQIGSTGQYNEVKVTYADARFDPYQTSLTTDDVVNEEVSFTGFYDSSEAYLCRMLLVNDVSSY